MSGLTFSCILAKIVATSATVPTKVFVLDLPSFKSCPNPFTRKPYHT